ncbi:MAG: dTDP-glucose 4,6-dehydratase [Myxococcales bacterium]|nr:dTDP-glucose 4,6-dehydratase [Myxococcales bacterium]
MSSNPPHFQAIVRQRYSRRDMLQVLGAAGLAAGLGCTSKDKKVPSQPATVPAVKVDEGFVEVSHGADDHHHVPPGYQAAVLIGWGDSLTDGTATGDLAAMTPEEQSVRFGTNCDYTAFMPLPPKNGLQRGLLCVNHEFSDAGKMFRGVPAGRRTSKDVVTKLQVEGELAAHGHSIVELQQTPQGWQIVPGPYTRRISALKTLFEITGPAAGHARMKTPEDPEGKTIKSTVGNCSGGVTPWGTVLIAEENFNYYFGGDPAGLPQEQHLRRYNVNGRAGIGAWRFFDRFDVTKVANEPNRFGWMVEYKPTDPNYQPKKRTALGRFCHEGATLCLTKSGHAVAYMGDDSYFEYLYRFVSDKPAIDNPNVLDEGTLSVARFDANGTLSWLPLRFGEGPLTPQNGFESQADVVIETRRAADLLGATPMDRPEGIAIHPTSGRVYVSLTKNTRREASQTDAVHARAQDAHGQILEIIPSAHDAHDEESMGWDILIAAGDPSRHANTKYGKGLTREGWLANPDNLAFDPSGHLWISTDGALGSTGTSDGLWCCETLGDGRAVSKRFLRVPKGAECTGASFTPDGKTLFVSVQHPGAYKSASYDEPSSRWPDHKSDRPSRSAVLVITKENGGVIGT